jgi:cytosine/creatinine deaminase
VFPSGKTRHDVRVDGGRVSNIAEHLTVQDGDQVIEGANMLLLPGFVDAHTHADKTLIGQEWHSHRAGPSVHDRILNEREVLRSLEIDSQVQSERLVRRMIARGTTHIRTHVDIVPEIGLKHLDGVVATRDRYAGRIDIQIVAFPQLGVMAAPGTAELLNSALQAGADVVGGLDPMAIDRDPKGQLDAIFSMAEHFGCGVDIHLHESGDLGAATLDMIIDRTRACALQGHVVVSHAFCLGSVTPARLETLMRGLADADIAIMTHGPSGGLPSPPVRYLHDSGVRVFSGSDGVRDAWGPLNTGDMLERAYLVSYINGFRHDDDLELALHMATYAGAQVLGLPSYGLDVGCPADLVLVKADNAAHAVAEHPVRALVMKNGEIVARDGECLIFI